MNASMGPRLPDADVSELSQYIDSQLSIATSIHRAHYPHGQDPTRKIEVIRGTDVPKQGVTTWCTLGLAHLSWSDQGFPDRNELVGALKNSDVDFAKVLATVAHAIVDTRIFPRPGGVMIDAVAMCGLGELSKRMPHALYVFPYTWEDGFVGTQLSVGKVWMLQVVPIYEDEYAFIKRFSFAEFEELLEAKGVALIDPGRQNCLKYT